MHTRMFLLFNPLDEIKLLFARVVVREMILPRNIINIRTAIAECFDTIPDRMNCNNKKIPAS
jgi:hypothetical protein